MRARASDAESSEAGPQTVAVSRQTSLGRIRMTLPLTLRSVCVNVLCDARPEASVDGYWVVIPKSQSSLKAEHDERC